MNQTGGALSRRQGPAAAGPWARKGVGMAEVLFGYATGYAFPTLRGHTAGSTKVPAEVFLKWLLASLSIQLNSEWMTFLQFVLPHLFATDAIDLIDPDLIP
jgi:hypothetical protein